MIPAGAATADQVVSRAYLVADGDFTGTVHSVFAHACNLVVGDRLVTVHDAAAAHTPTSIRVTGPWHTRWSPVVRPGQAAQCRAGVLRVGGHALNLSGIPVWAPLSPLRRTAPGMELRLAELARHRLAHRPGAAAPPAPGLRPAVERLRELMARPAVDVPALTGAASALVGLGPGLTPSGDDVLVGVLAGLIRGGGNIPAAAAAAIIIGDAVAVRARSTTDVSRHYLTLAAQGHFGQPLTELVDAVVDGSPAPQQRRRMDAVLAVGASSGADALLGVLIGLSAVAQWSSTERQLISQKKAA